MTIKGVKKQLQFNQSNLDEADNKTINRKILKAKINKISSLIKNFKNNG
jgi:hypothetical protein